MLPSEGLPKVQKDYPPIPKKLWDQEAKQRLRPSDFVGAKKCKQCHEEQYQQWSHSSHGMSGGWTKPAWAEHFAGGPLQFRDAVVKLKFKKNAYYFELEEEQKETQSLKVFAVVGQGKESIPSVQSYFTQSQDGTLRLLPFSYIRSKNQWVCRTSKNEQSKESWQPISLENSLYDCNDWPIKRTLGSHESFEHGCSSCHGSQVQLIFDQKKKTYQTNYKSLHVNCEACHGPGRKHTKLMKSKNVEQLQDIGMLSLENLSKRDSVYLCLKCHANKLSLGKGGEDHDFLWKDLETKYSFLMSDLGKESTFSKDEGFHHPTDQKNILYSDCHINGSMTCVSCHSPHSHGYRDETGEAWEGPADNRLCLGCHESKRHKLEEHTHHQQGSTGSLCIGCHMPSIQHGATHEAWMARTDHRIRIPRLEYQGGDHVCQGCHADKDQDWINQSMKKNWGQLKPMKAVVSALLHSQDLALEDGSHLELLSSSPSIPIAQAKALWEYSKRFIAPNMQLSNDAAIQKLQILTESTDIDLQAISLAMLHMGRSDEEVVSLLKATALRDKGRVLGIRKRWSMFLLLLASEYSRSDKPDELKIAWELVSKSLEINRNNKFAGLMRGVIAQKQGHDETAKESFKQILKSDPWSYKALNLYTKLLAEQKAYRTALPYAKKLGELRGDKISVNRTLAALFWHTGQKKAAIAKLNKSLKLAKKSKKKDDPVIKIISDLLENARVSVEQKQ